MQLVVQTGPDAGKVFNLDRPLLVLGRQVGSDLLLSDAQVSRRHVQFELRQGQLFITDSGSANGTFVNGQRLPANQPRLLQPGDLIRLGDTSLAVQGSPAFVRPAVPVPPPAPAPFYPAPPPVYPAQPQPPYYNQQAWPGYAHPVYPAQPPRKAGGKILLPGIVVMLILGGLLLGAVAILGIISQQNLNGAASARPGVVTNAPPALTSAPATPTVVRGLSGTNLPPPSPPGLTSLARPVENISVRWADFSGTTLAQI